MSKRERERTKERERESKREQKKERERERERESTSANERAHTLTHIFILVVSAMTFSKSWRRKKDDRYFLQVGTEKKMTAILQAVILIERESVSVCGCMRERERK